MKPQNLTTWSCQLTIWNSKKPKQLRNGLLIWIIFNQKYIGKTLMFRFTCMYWEYLRHETASHPFEFFCLIKGCLSLQQHILQLVSPQDQEDALWAYLPLNCFPPWFPHFYPIELCRDRSQSELPPWFCIRELGRLDISENTCIYYMEVKINEVIRPPNIYPWEIKPNRWYCKIVWHKSIKFKLISLPSLQWY